MAMSLPVRENIIRRGEHVAPSSVFQHGLCEEFTKRPSRTFHSGEIIYNIGDISQSAFYLRRGLVKLTALSEDGKEIILAMRRPGEIFGEFCLCSGLRTETVTTMESSDVVEIKVEELVKYIQEDQGASYNLLIAVCERLSKAYQIIEELSFDELPDRLAKVLLRLAGEYGNETGSGTELSCYVTQEELAQMVSARREVVSAMLNRLRKQGLIDYTRKSKMIIHQENLAAYVEEKTELENDAKEEDEQVSHLVMARRSLGRTQHWGNRSLKEAPDLKLI
jgi:CRP/FNR family cyclic AMP-dependent transcriptional regulator